MSGVRGKLVRKGILNDKKGCKRHIVLQKR
jgi:hypothetical protein